MDIEFFKKLCETPSPSGYEEQASKLFADKCSSILSDKYNLSPDIYSIKNDAIGNTIVRVGRGLKKVMVSGHIDEIGLQVQNIDDDGFIHFVKIGGIDRKVLPGSTVQIMTQSGFPRFGVIGKAPIHVEWRSDDKDKVLDIKDLKIDCGYESKQEAMGDISAGDPIIVKDIPIAFGNRIFSRGIDDKVGVWVAVEAIDSLINSIKDESVYEQFSFYFVACTQEEVGADGASVAAKAISPNLSIDYDVHFATDDGTVDKNQYGDVKLGKGGAIAYGPDKNVKLCRFFEDVCKKNNIAYQPFVAPIGGTDTETIKLQSMNPMTQTILLSIPERNMHTQVECCDVRDVQSLVDMTVCAIKEMINGNYEI